MLTKETKYREEIGTAGAGRAVTATLYVSPNGNNTDGRTWKRAFNTIQGALAAASSDADALTQILIGPHATNYDINTTGDPTYAGNYILKGSHRNWAQIVNGHGTATSIMKFTGKVSLMDLTIDCGAGTNNGIIIDNMEGPRLRRVFFDCESVTGAQTALTLSGGAHHPRLEDVLIQGVIANTKGLLLDNCMLGNFTGIEFHDCLIGLQITNAASDANEFVDIIFHICTLALDIDAGNGQQFEHLQFAGCDTNIDDEVGDHDWDHLEGEFPITQEPDNFTGVVVATHANPDTWTAAEVEIRAAATSTTPFRVVGVRVEANANEKFRIRLTADGGATYFSDTMLEGNINAVQREAVDFPSGTEFIFNKGTQIAASSKSESGSNQVVIWLEIQASG